MTKLFLCCLERLEDFYYQFCNHASYSCPSDPSYHQRRLRMADNVAEIINMTISASIFSPLVLTVTCDKREVPIKKIIPYNSVYGVIFNCEIPGTDTSDVYCLFSHSNHYIIPFVVTEVKYIKAEEYPKKRFVIKLMEKRALSLALTHSFACIAEKKPSDQDIVNNGILSIGEIVKRLSTVPEEEDDAIENWSNKKNIFSFDIVPALKIAQDGGAANEKYYCACLSRFIAPNSQSRLETIISLMSKYGYGFVYRMADRQYYAVDLLSNDAPGFYNSNCRECADRGFYYDNHIFFGLQSRKYFAEYGRQYFLENNINSKYFASFDKEADKLEAQDYIHYFCHNFEDFYCRRLLKRCANADTKYYSMGTGAKDYNCFSRYTPLASATCLRTNRDDSPEKKNFDLLLLTKIPSGAQNVLYEDQVELNLPEGEEDRKDNVIDEAGTPIDTVNARLALAKYKLKHMLNNYIKQTFVFKNTEGLSFGFNIVYELLNWLGFHTDVFQKVAQSCVPKIIKRNSQSLSNPPYSLKYEFKSQDDIDKELKSLFEGDADFFANMSNYNSSPAIFGRVDIKIDSEIHNNDIVCYSLTPTLTFFSDDIQNNLGNYNTPEEVKPVFFTDSVDSKINEPFLLIPETATEFVNTDLKQESIKAADDFVFDFSEFEDWALEKRDFSLNNSPRWAKGLIKNLEKEESSYFDYDEESKKESENRESSYFDFDEENKEESENRLHKELSKKSD